MRSSVRVLRCSRLTPEYGAADVVTRVCLAVYEKLKDQIDAENWNPENEEEFEDSEGNVLNRKTFEDLARQGLL